MAQSGNSEPCPCDTWFAMLVRRSGPRKLIWFSRGSSMPRIGLLINPVDAFLGGFDG